jgi:hypothetical protein
MKTITVIVSPAGQARIETQGFVGPACFEADQFLRRALGTTTDEQRTTEYMAVAITSSTTVRT